MDHKHQDQRIEEEIGANVSLKVRDFSLRILSSIVSIVDSLTHFS